MTPSRGLGNIPEQKTGPKQKTAIKKTRISRSKQVSGRSQKLLAACYAVAVKTIIYPEWAREKQITAQFALSHMILFNLRKAGKIRTLSLRGEGKQYGARLYNIASVREYLAAQEAAELQPGGAR